MKKMPFMLRISTLLLLAILPLSGCSEGDGDGGKDAAADAPEVVTPSTDTGAAGTDSSSGASVDIGSAAVDAGPACTPKEGKIAALKFSAPTEWSEPLKDYHKVGFSKAPSGKFLQGVQDLAVFLDRLYIGYGDANINLGSKQQLTVRYFDKCGSTQTVDEFKHDEEQIDRFRHLGDELWIAGIDATEDGWLGNVYRREKDQGWVKHRTVGSGVHVHDVARFGGDVYAVGSGNTPDGWKEGDIYGWLWRSSDNGKTFIPVDKEWNLGKGDSRFVHLVPAGPRLYVFGYKIDLKGQLSSVPNKVWDGKTATFLAPDHPLHLRFIRQSWPVSESAGVVTGQNLLEGNGAPMRTWLLTAKTATVIKDLADRVVVDVFKRADTAEFILLTRPGASPASPSNGTVVKWKVTLTTDFKSFTDVMSFDATVNIESLAFWQGGLYLGTSHGHVYRSMGK